MAAASEVPSAEADARELFLQPVTSRNPFEDAVTQLTWAIRLGAVAVGEKFPPERELGKMLHVSRTTVREAIRGLEQSGYIVTRRGRFGGTFVLRDAVKPSARDRGRALGPRLLESLDFRAAVEPGAVALAARKADREQVQRMRILNGEMERGAVTAFLRANSRLHILFAQAADCAPLLKTVTALELQVLEALLTVSNLDQFTTDSISEHASVIEAIAAGDARTARDAMARHLAGADAILRELVTSRRRRS